MLHGDVYPVVWLIRHEDHLNCTIMRCDSTREIRKRTKKKIIPSHPYLPGTALPPPRHTMSRQAWDSVSSAFARYTNALFSLHAHDLLSPLSELSSPCTILDVACGAGAIPLAYLSLCPEGHAEHTFLVTDFSPGMVEEARRAILARKPQSCATTFEFLVQDATTLSDIADASVDLVVSTFGISTIHPPQPILQHVHRVLKPSGKLALSAWAPLPEVAKAALVADKRAFPFFEIAQQPCMALRPQNSPAMQVQRPWETWSDVPKAQSLLERNGFQNVIVHYVLHTHPFPSFDDMWQRLTAANVFLDIGNIDANVVKEAREAMRVRMDVSEDEVITLLSSSQIFVCSKQS